MKLVEIYWIFSHLYCINTIFFTLFFCSVMLSWFTVTVCPRTHDPILYCYLLYKMVEDFLDIQYVRPNHNEECKEPIFFLHNTNITFVFSLFWSEVPKSTVYPRSVVEFSQYTHYIKVSKISYKYGKNTVFFYVQ